MSDEKIAWENWSDDENASWRFQKYSVEALSLIVFQDYELTRILEDGNPLPATKEILNLDYEKIIKEFLTEEAVKTTLSKKQTELNAIKEEIDTALTPELLEKYSSKEKEIETLNKILENFEDGIYIKGYIKELASSISEILYSNTNMEETIILEIDNTTGLWRKWANSVWEDAYTQSGLIYGEDKEYSISDIEHAFIDYDNNNNYSVSDIFYMMIFGYISPNKFMDAKDRGVRASVAANELANLKNVTDLYMIGYGNSAEKSWMNPSSGHKNAVTNEKIKYLHLNKVEDSLEISKPITGNIEETGFHDLTVIDYLSKWGILQTNTIRIYSGNEVIYEYNTQTGTYEWLIPEEERPVKDSEPIIITKLTPEEIEAAGEDVKGNTNSDVYKIIWKVKDGELYKTDNFHIEYEVYLDTEEEGFEFGKEYPTNGHSSVGYGFNKETKTESIVIPSMSVNKEDIIPNNPQTSDNISKSILLFTICFSVQSLLITNYIISKKRENEKV